MVSAIVVVGHAAIPGLINKLLLLLFYCIASIVSGTI